MAENIDTERKLYTIKNAFLRELDALNEKIEPLQEEIDFLHKVKKYIAAIESDEPKK